MIDSATLSALLNYAVLAPSADNLQPWTIRNCGEHLDIFLQEKKAIPSIGNIKNTASLVSLGALIENLDIAAQEMGYAVQVELFPRGEVNSLVASIRFQAQEKVPQKLFPYLSARCTNRRPYLNRPLDPSARKALCDIARDSKGELTLVEDEAQKRLVTRAVCVNDRILFEQRDLHRYLFSSLRWSEKEAQETRDGLYIKTFELGAAAWGFRMLKFWSFARLINALGAGCLLPLTSYRLCRSSSALGLFQMNGVSAESFLKGGRVMQRIWLMAASFGLALQPMTGIAYFIQRLYQEDAQGLSDRHKRLIMEAEGILKGIFPLDRNKSMILLFRLGYTTPPSARSLRRAPVA
jgi:hypothetical protein